MFVVYMFPVDVVSGDAKRSFTADTDIPWDEFRNRIMRYLENSADEVRLSCKIYGDNSRASLLNDHHDFKAAMDRVCHRAQNARTREISLEIKNIVSRIPVNAIPQLISVKGQTQKGEKMHSC